MLSLKIYNSLSLRKRQQIAKIVFFNMGEDFINEMALPFHHNFDYDGGHWYKMMLSCCNYNKEKKHITITMHIPVTV